MANDPALEAAVEQVRRAMSGQTGKPQITGFFHEPTFGRLPEPEDNGARYLKLPLNLP